MRVEKTMAPTRPERWSQMEREIREQPVALERSLHAMVAQLGELRQFVRARDTVLFYARGSSDTAAVYGRYLCEIIGARVAALGAPSTATLYGAVPDLGRCLVVVLSQSGETVELLEVERWARARGARTVAVTNHATSPLAVAADVALVIDAGPEHAIPATKTYGCQLAALAVLVAAFLPAGHSFVDGFRTIPLEAEHLLAITPVQLDAMVELYLDATGLVVSGRGYTLSTAAELALKVQETCALPALALSTADLQHGPSRVLAADHPVLAVAGPGGPADAGLLAMLDSARARGAKIGLLGGTAALVAGADASLPGPALPEELAPVVGAIPGQLLVESLCRRLGLDPDAPPGLTKVTQTTQ
jgi:glutamine---fructose-6-phosphate transaminase (isomerizing)